jgi:hypothetical protein
VNYDHYRGIAEKICHPLDMEKGPEIAYFHQRSKDSDNVHHYLVKGIEVSLMGVLEADREMFPRSLSEATAFAIWPECGYLRGSEFKTEAQAKRWIQEYL